MARAKSAARREAIITSLLVIAGIVLAICLFAAGLFWRGKPTTRGAFADGSGNTSVPTPAPAVRLKLYSADCLRALLERAVSRGTSSIGAGTLPLIGGN